MGQAGSIIGLGLQGVGMFAGGGKTQTQYVDTQSAKYETDMLAMQSALENQKRGESILRGQVDAQRSFDRYSFDLQNQISAAETENAMLNVNAQYNAALVENSMSRMNNELSRYTQLAQYNQSMTNTDYQNATLKRQLQLQKVQRDVDLQVGNATRGITRANLASQGSYAGLENNLAKKRFNLEDAALTDTETGIGYKQQGLDLSRQDLVNKEAEANQGFDTQSATGNIQQSLTQAGTEQQRGDNLRELLRMAARNEQEFALFESLSSAQGIESGTQNQQFDQLNNESVASQRSSMMGQYGLGLNQAEIGNSMTQNQVNTGRANMRQGMDLARQGLMNQEGQLGLERNQLSQGRANLDFNRRQQEGKFAYDETTRELEGLRMNIDQEYDLMSKSLIPNVSDYGQYLAGQWNTVNQKYGLGLQNYAQTQQLDQANRLLQRGAESDLGSAGNALDQLLANYLVQGNSAITSYLSNQGNTEMSLNAGLGQLGSQTHGLLSQLGGYSSPPPVVSGGGGFNIGALSGLIEQGMGVFGGFGGGGGGGGSSYQNLGHSMPSPAPYSGSRSYSPNPVTTSSTPPAPYMGRR